MDDANAKCRPSSDQDGERWCAGEFNDQGVAVQPTAESITELDRWCDEQGRASEQKGSAHASDV